ncbi:MAG: hypothetical protein IJR68_07320, partial [Fretibacterium sp.]|nr:hypothetical protein [Fretibacterium sp.]
NNEGNRRYTSCAAAYNSVIHDVDTKYVIYSHQDIRLKEKDTLEKFVRYLDRLNQDDLLGVAGIRFDDEDGIYSNIVQIYSKTGKLHLAGAAYVEGMIPCDTLDECFFGGYTEHFLKHPFDEKLCDSWHLYAVERCLNTKVEGRKEGKENAVYVCDVLLFHLSSGNVNSAFVKGFCKICKHYASDFPVIKTTCAGSKTGTLQRFDFFWYHTNRFYRFMRDIDISVRRAILRALGMDV